MSEFFIGQVMFTGFNFAPRFWALCNGQLLPINQNQALFSLLGTQYGGNGTTNFALPDLRGRVPVGYASSVDPTHQPPSVQIGETGGVENVTLLSTNLPVHSHSVGASSGAPTSGSPANAFFADNANSYVPASPSGAVTLAVAGNNQPHPNISPYSVINACIALSGIFPSRN